MRHPLCVSLNDSPSPDQQTFFVNLCQILQKLPQRYTVYFVRRHHGSGQKLNKTRLIVLRLFSAYSDSILLHYDPTAELVLQYDICILGVARSCLQPGPDDTLQPGY